MCRKQPLPTMSDVLAASDRPSFQQRLLLTLGTSLAVAFLVLGVLLWLVARGWMQYHAHTLLEHEATEIASSVITPGGRFNPNRYAWGEPHHRFAARRIDPYFVQVFDADGQLLKASDNIAAFPAQTYPHVLLAQPAQVPVASFAAPATFRANDSLLYYLVHPLTGRNGSLLGYVQVARFEPGLAPALRRIALLLAAGLGGLLGLLLLLVHTTARHTTRPLTAITAAARDLTPHTLSHRVPVPPDADRETTQLATTLNTQIERLERSFEEMQRFTSNAAHELQTPLTVLQGHIDLALRRPRSPESYQQTLRVLHDELDMMSRMVRSLLTLARLDRKQAADAQEPVDLSRLALAVVERFEPRAQAKGLRFAAYIEEDVWTSGVADWLHEALSNVLDNAIKYTTCGSVRLELCTTEGRATLTIQDTGSGMATEALPYVTDRFYRASDAQHIPGNGLGLALVAQIVAAHQGTLHITSTPGEGTTVEIELPQVHEAGRASV